MKVILETKCGCRREIQIVTETELLFVAMHNNELVFENPLPSKNFLTAVRSFKRTGLKTHSGLAGFEKYPLFREV
jgi:hypothetical protein